MGDGELKVGSRTKKQPLCTHGSTESSTVYLSGREGRWKQSYTKCSLISAPQWHRTPHSGLSWIYKVTNMIPIKADPAICNGVSGYIVLKCDFYVQQKTGF